MATPAASSAAPKPPSRGSSDPAPAAGAGPGAGTGSATEEEVAPRIVNAAAGTTPKVDKALDHSLKALLAVSKKELRSSAEDAKALEQLNSIMEAHFQEAGDNLSQIEQHHQRAQARREALQPFVSQIGQLEASVTDLEQLVAKLDTSSIHLEDQFYRSM